MIFAGKNYEQQQQQRVPADSKRPDDSSTLINEKCCISVNLTYSRLQINHQDSSALFDALLLGYVPLAEVAAELLFQVVAERAEKASVIVTTNLPFSEWRRSSPTLGSARPSSNGSPTRPTSSRQVQSLREEEDQRVSLGAWFYFRYALRATLQQNRACPTSTAQSVGQNKPPKWATPSCQSQPGR